LACAKIVKSLRVNVVENLEIFNVVDGKTGTFYDFVDGVKVKLDDGRMRPRDDGDDFNVLLRDDGRLIPRRFCVDFNNVMDGRLWMFNDGG